MKFKLPKNISLMGRLGRLFFALIILYFAYSQRSWILFAVSLFVMFESLMSWCVLYHILGINKCPIKKESNRFKEILCVIPHKRALLQVHCSPLPA
jgi:hypothetical protein